MTDTELHRLLHPTPHSEEYLSPDYGSVLFGLCLGKTVIDAWEDYKYQSCIEWRRAYSLSLYQERIRELKEKYPLPETESEFRITLLKGISVCGSKTDVLYAEVAPAGYCFATVLQNLNLKPRPWIFACRALLRHIESAPNRLVYIGHLPSALSQDTESFAAHYGMSLSIVSDKSFAREFTDLCASSSQSSSLPPSLVIDRIIAELNARPLFPFSLYNHNDALNDQKLLFHSLPSEDYEVHETKFPKVQANFHVSIERKYYSVPFEYRHDKITAVVSDNYVELLSGDDLLCTHPKLHPGGPTYSTIPEHMPESDDDIPRREVSGRSLRRWAAHIGPHVHEVIDAILSSSMCEPQVYLPCRFILSLASRYGNDKLDGVCKLALLDKSRMNRSWIERNLAAQHPDRNNV